ncbi:hypothetical protein LTR86_003792 [Recurvomyces mirabilis]|nr:hypothetical protein LTR86_003792 [Recurvomyces mirabilis]
MATTSRKGYVLALPNELLVIIATPLDKTDLIAVHATCHSLFTSLDEIYLDRCFATRRHVYTLHGLQALLDMTQVTRLVRRIRRVELVAYDLATSMRPGYCNPYRPLLFGKASPQADERLREAAAKRQRTWELWQAEEKALCGPRVIQERKHSQKYDPKTTDPDVTLLSEAFSNLAMVGKLEVLCLITETRGDYVPWRQGWGLQHLLRESQVEESMLRNSSCEEETKAVLVALAAAALTVCSLELFQVIGEKRLARLPEQPAQQVIDAARGFCKSLDSITVRHDDLRVYNHSPTFTKPPSILEEALGSATGLKHLAITQSQYAGYKEDWYADEHLKDTLFSIATHDLRTLSLDTVPIRIGDLIRVVEQFRGSLNELRLSDVSIQAHECFTELGRAVGRCKKLAKLEMVYCVRGAYFDGIECLVDNESKASTWCQKGQIAYKSRPAVEQAFSGEGGKLGYITSDQFWDEEEQDEGGNRDGGAIEAEEELETGLL